MMHPFKGVPSNDPLPVLLVDTLDSFKRKAMQEAEKTKKALLYKQKMQQVSQEKKTPVLSIVLTPNLSLKEEEAARSDSVGQRPGMAPLRSERSNHERVFRHHRATTADGQGGALS